MLYTEIVRFMLRDTNNFIISVDVLFSIKKDFAILRLHWMVFSFSLNCVLGQDTEIGILKRHIMHVSHI